MLQHVTQPRTGTSIEIINLHVTPDMVPSVRLIVYYVQSGEGAAELVADSVWFDVQDKCVNGLKVSLKHCTHTFAVTTMIWQCKIRSNPIVCEGQRGIFYIFHPHT